MNKKYGDLFPYGDPNWYHSFNSPFYTDSHRRWRKIVREFVAREITPHVTEWEEAYAMPKEFYRKAGEAGMLAACVGEWPTEYIGQEPVENWDPFHELIFYDELARCGSGGVCSAITVGIMTGIPPIMNFGSDYLKQKVIPDCIQGKKVICIAISEPWAASDVANLRTSARREGDYYIVNGAKKWITNGVYADFFLTVVRTGTKESGMNGLSLLLLEREMPGMTVTQLKCQGSWSSGTSFITLEDVKVPVKNLIGKEGEGFKLTMYNFNHERWVIVALSNRLARVALNEAFKYSLKRETFGKKLIEHQDIRMKIGHMARQVESAHAWMEQITYQLKTMSKFDAMKTLGDTMALLKVQSTRTLEFCAREALHVFGGSGYVRSGVGETVERIYRDAQSFAIPGGAEAIMVDYAIRTATKYAKRLAKL